jgi:hypothetical protein
MFIKLAAWDAISRSKLPPLLASLDLREAINNLSPCSHIKAIVVLASTTTNKQNEVTHFEYAKCKIAKLANFDSYLCFHRRATRLTIDHGGDIAMELVARAFMLPHICNMVDLLRFICIEAYALKIFLMEFDL